MDISRASVTMEATITVVTIADIVADIVVVTMAGITVGIIDKQLL